MSGIIGMLLALSKITYGVCCVVVIGIVLLGFLVVTYWIKHTPPKKY